MKITAAQLRKLAPGANSEAIEAMAETAPTSLPKYGITTARRMQHFFSQMAHESGGLKRFEENLNYSAKRLTQVWPSRFPSISAAQPYANNPRKLANKVYNGRMGNRTGSDDGYDFRGRGPIQITGRDGYRKVGFEDDPDQAALPENYLEVAGRFWKWKNLNPLADKDNVNEVTKRINGGLNGLADRKEYLAKAKKIFTEDLDAAEEEAEVEAFEDAEASKPDMSDPAEVAKPVSVAALPPLQGEEVKGDLDLWNTQRRLREMNYSPGALDGTWGGMTAAAIAGFINDRGLSIAAPTSLAMFRTVFNELKEALSEAEAAKFSRPVNQARALATAKDIEGKLPTIKQTIWSRFIAKIQAIGTMIVAAFWAAIEWLQSGEHTGPVVDALGKVPRYAWVATGFVIVGVLSGLIWRSQRKAEQLVVDQYREGKIQ